MNRSSNRSLADAQLSLGQLAAAATAFERNHAQCAVLEHPITFVALAGLVGAALAAGDPGRAARISDAALRERFPPLTEHRAIAVAWAAQQHLA